MAKRLLFTIPGSDVDKPAAITFMNNALANAACQGDECALPQAEPVNAPAESSEDPEPQAE